MINYTVKISEEAQKSISDIFDYIKSSFCSPQSAAGQADRIVQAIGGLSIFPKRGKAVQHKKWQKHILRRILVDNYTVFYTVVNTDVVILNVLYSRSDLDKLLEEI